IIGPKVLDPSGKVWCAGGEIAFHQNISRLRGYGSSDNGSYDKTEPVDYLPACCILISREVFDRIGLLDEDYFCYLEDVEFCLRASRAGFPVTYFPGAKVCHYCSHSTGGGYSAARKYMNALNSVRFLKKYGTLKMWLAFWLLDFCALPLVFFLRLFKGQTRGATAKFRGLLDGLAGRKVTPERLERFHGTKEEKK
ncbi:MAG: glycosyltransferase family 2 protein, partial [Planctomycetota bacterium]